MIAAYLRVSSVGQNLAGQRAEVEKWLAGREASWYVDEAQSGSSLDRPAFASLQLDVASNKVRTIVVYKLDRISRQLVEGLHVLQEWAEAGIRVVSVTQQIDFSGAVGKMLAAVFLGIAEMERETLLERQRAGIDAARAAGKRWGGSKKGPRLPQESLDRARGLIEMGLSRGEVAVILGVSERTVYRLVKESNDDACHVSR